MEKIVLKAEVRLETGKKAAKDIRKKDMIPAVVYKSGKSATSLTLAKEDIDQLLRSKASSNVIITLDISGGEGKAQKPKTVLVKEVQRDPIKRDILHVDFNEISLTEMLKVNVAIHAHGEAVGVKKDGGILEHVLWELQVECLPTDIPQKIEVDVTNLGIGQAIHVKDIVLPRGVKALNDPELIVMIVKPPKVEVPKEEVAAEGAAEPELIRKKKEEGEEGEKAPKEAAKETKDTKEAK